MIALARSLPGGVTLDDPALFRSFAHVGNRWTAGATRQEIAVTDPATGEAIGAVAKLTGKDSASAVDTAHAAFPAWAATLPQERARLLRRWYELIVASREDLARIMTA